MPMYSLRCDNGHEFDLYLKFKDLELEQFCVCGRPAVRIIQAPHIFVQKDICYDSPIDGRPITSKQARIEDLKRTGCIPYEEGMKQDHDRRAVEAERNLDSAVDETVEREVALMPSRKREKLFSELESGLTVEPTRMTREA